MNISIIIPLYNKEHHIKRAIDSVLAQTYQDFELIIVDDGSTDNSKDVVRTYEDPRIRLIIQDNSGVSIARNRGVAASKYELIAFLDADDEWHNDFLKTVSELRKRFPEAAVWGTAYATTNGVTMKCMHPSSVSTQTHGYLINIFQTFNNEGIQQPCNASSIMVCKKSFLKIGGFMPSLVLLEDTDLLFRLALRYPIAYCPLVKSIYHNETEHRSDAWRYYGIFPFFDHARDYIRECGDTHKLSEDIMTYVGCYQIRGLYHNWYAGNRANIRKIISECTGIKGYRLKCLIWRLLIWVPHPLVICYWKLNAKINGRNCKLPPIRSIYRKL